MKFWKLFGAFYAVVTFLWLKNGGDPIANERPRVRFGYADAPDELWDQIEERMRRERRFESSASSATARPPAD
jgi:hypothetical protein